MLFGEVVVLTSIGWPLYVKLPVLKAWVGTMLVLVSDVENR